MTITNDAPALPQRYDFLPRHAATPAAIMSLRRSVGWDPDTADIWQQTLDQVPIFIGVEFRGELIGMAYAAGTKRHAVLCDLCVHPDHQGRKIGLAIIQELLRQCNESGIKYLYGEMSDKNPFAELFREQGFTISGRSLFRARPRTEQAA